MCVARLGLVIGLAFLVMVGFVGCSPWPFTTSSSCTADFEADITHGEGRTRVSFTDKSTGNIDTWEWDFDDNGRIDLREQNPRWLYKHDGLYSVSLRVRGPDCDDKITKKDYIEMTECPT